jgi:ATP-binding cassette subfamily B protein
MRGRTTLLIAHRRSTLRLADRIVVLDGGRVVDTGTHDELLARCPTYRHLLAGPGDDAEGIDAGTTGDVTAPGPAADIPDGEAPVPAGITPSAWATDGEAPRPRAALELPGGPFAHGGGGGGAGMGHGAGMLAAAVPASPELLAALARLPTPTDRPDVDVAAQRSPAAGPFSLGAFVAPYRAALAVGVGLVALDALATLAGPWLVRWGIDHGVVRGATRALWAATAAFTAVALADWAVIWAQTRQTGRTAERMLFALRVRIFAHLQRLGLDFYEREMAGRIMTRMTTDVEALSQLLQSGLVSAVVNLITFVGVAGLLLAMNTELALVTMTVVPPLVAATVAFRRLSDRAYLEARDRIAAVNATLQENLSGVRVAQAFVRESRNRHEFREVARRHLDARMKAQRLQSLYFPFVELLSVAATVLVLGVGAGMIDRGTLTAGALVAFLLYLAQFFSPIQQLSQVFDTYQQARAAMTKIRELLAIPSSTPPPARPVRPGRLRGAIRLEGVSFRYPGSAALALRGVDLDVAPGETVALVGETGAGKSTIVKLVARFYDPSAGRVLVDGHDLRDLDLIAYRRQLGYVPQEPFLFSGTIRDNIAYGRPEATDAEVEAAARSVGAHEFITTLPGGYRHPVTERGRSLSAGQRQLIALARARLVDPAILLLDEATANLDLATEARVNRAMGVVAAGRTTLLIAHRLQTARSADRIVVVHDGRVVESGTHDELVAAGGRYAAMWDAFAITPAAAPTPVAAPSSSDSRQ